MHTSHRPATRPGGNEMRNGMCYSCVLEGIKLEGDTDIFQSPTLYVETQQRFEIQCWLNRFEFYVNHKKAANPPLFKKEQLMAIKNYYLNSIHYYQPYNTPCHGDQGEEWLWLRI